MMEWNQTIIKNKTDVMILTDIDLLALSVVTVATLLLGVVLNGLVCAVFLLDKKMLDKPANVMIFSITSSDFLQSLVASPMLLLAALKGEWVLGMDGCRIYGFLMTWFGLVSITHLSALAVERYFSLKHAMTKGSGLRGKGKQIVFLLWLYSLFWSVAPFIGWSNYTMEPSKISCSVKWYSRTDIDLSYNVSLIIFCFAIPVSAIVFFYVAMLLTVKSISTRAIVNWGRRASFTRRTIKHERGMMGLVIAMIVAFLFSWTPYVCASIAAMLGNRYATSPLVTTIASFTAKTSTLYNPVLYVYMYRDFKISMLRYMRTRRGSDFSNSSSRLNTPRSRSLKLAAFQRGEFV